MMRAALICIALASGIATAEPLVAFTDAPAGPEVRALAGSRIVGVHYGAALDPASLHVDLNGLDVSARFHPQADTDEQVELPFGPGVNRLTVDAHSTGDDAHPPVDEFVTRDITFARLPGDASADTRLKSLPELRKEVWDREHDTADGAQDAGAVKPAAKDTKDAGAAKGDDAVAAPPVADPPPP